MNNSPFWYLMAAFSGTAAVLGFYIALWYSLRDMYGLAALWAFLVVDLIIKTVYFVARSKKHGN